MDKHLKVKIIQGESAIKNYIINNNIAGLNFIYGDESYLKLYYANKLSQKVVNSDFEDFNLHRIDGKNTEVDKIAEAVESMPMFSDKTCVYINDLPINDMDETEIEKLKLILNDIPETCVLILLMDTVERKVKKDKQLETENPDSGNSEEKGVINNSEKQTKKNMWDEILTIALNKGHAIELNKKASSELVEILMKGAVDRGRKIERNTAYYLIDCVGNDLCSLQNELDKICLFSKNVLIAKSDIDAVAVKSVEAKVFGMANMLLSNNFEGAFSILDSLFIQKAEPPQILGAFITPFIDMYRLKTASAACATINNIAEYFDYKENKIYRLKNLPINISKLSAYQIKSCLNLLEEADTLIKRRSIDAKLVFEQTMAKISVALKS